MWSSTGCPARPRRPPDVTQTRTDLHSTRISAKAWLACILTPSAVSQITNVQSICAEFSDLLSILFGGNRNAACRELRHAAHQGAVPARICHPGRRYLLGAFQDVAELRTAVDSLDRGRAAGNRLDGNRRLLRAVKPWQRWKSRDSAAYDDQSLVMAKSGSTHGWRSTRRPEHSGRNSTGTLHLMQVAVRRMVSRPQCIGLVQSGIHYDWPSSSPRALGSIMAASRRVNPLANSTSAQSSPTPVRTASPVRLV